MLNKAKTIVFITTITLGILYGIFKIFKIDPTLPLNYTGDAVVHYNFAKNIQDTGWWATNPNYGAPTGQNLLDFPLTENFQILIIKMLIMLGLDWILAVNTYYILTFPFIVITAFFAMQKLGLKQCIATICAIIYAFIPYHFLRGVNHLFLSGYFVVPISIYLTFVHANNISLKNRYLFLITLLIASCGAYYTFFSTFLIFVATLISLVNGVTREKIFKAIKTFGLIIFFFFLNYFPTLIYSKANGQNFNTTVRIPSETELYGLKISQLILPFEDHNLNFMNKIQKRYLTYGSQSTNENADAALGVLGSIGFLFLLFWTIFRDKINLFDAETKHKINFLGILNISATLFATVGGFASILGTFITPVFRSENRISIIIAFLALLTVGLVLQSLKNKRVIYLISILALPLAIYDQVSIGVLRNFMRDSKDYAVLVKFASVVEEFHEKSDKIYTLPLGEYPEGSDKNMMKLALLSRKLIWSSGAEKMRASNYWQSNINKLPTEEFLQKIVIEGFSGLVIHNKEVDSLKLSEIGKILQAEPMQDEKHEYSYYNLKPFKKVNKLEVDPTNVFFYVSDRCLYDNMNSYYCSNNGKIELINISDKVQERNLKFKIEYANNKTEEVSNIIKIPSGQSYYAVSRKVHDYFTIPKSVLIWPLNIGYPNFIIKDIELKQTL